jgi:hypothetical protein
MYHRSLPIEKYEILKYELSLGLDDMCSKLKMLGLPLDDPILTEGTKDSGGVFYTTLDDIMRRQKVRIVTCFFLISLEKQSRTLITLGVSLSHCMVKEAGRVEDGRTVSHGRG